MTWTIWINFLPLSHGGSTLNLTSVGPLVSEKVFENTHIFLHTRTQQLRVVPDEKYGVSGRGGGALKAKHYIFVCVWGGGGGGGAVFFFFSFQWAVCFCENICRWWSFSKCSLFKWDLLEWKKKVPIFRRGLSRKNELCECHGGGVGW